MGDGQHALRVEFIRAHGTGNANGGNARRDISIYCRESNYITWRLARMNLAIRGIGGQIAVEPREDDEEPFDDKMKRLVAEHRDHRPRALGSTQRSPIILRRWPHPVSPPGD